MAEAHFSSTRRRARERRGFDGACEGQRLGREGRPRRQKERERERGKVENGGARHRLIGGDVPKSPPCHRMREHARRARRLVNVFFFFFTVLLCFGWLSGMLSTWGSSRDPSGEGERWRVAFLKLGEKTDSRIMNDVGGRLRSERKSSAVCISGRRGGERLAAGVRGSCVYDVSYDISVGYQWLLIVYPIVQSTDIAGK